MGEEIAGLHFRRDDFRDFQAMLTAETEELRRWFEGKRFLSRSSVAGCELEAWITDDGYFPVPLNSLLLEKMNNPLAVLELARFNVELNCPPRPLSGRVLGDLHRDLREIWRESSEAAASMGARMLMIGIHPTVEHTALTLTNISDNHRFSALNEQVMRLRRGRALTIRIKGHEELELAHSDLTFESAATSFQVHLQVPPEQSVRFYNASTIVSAATVAASANSPCLFGKDLWAETRIPLFEQAVSVQPPRVTFGNRYVEESLFECFEENLKDHPVLLPEIMDDPVESLHHLRLHNGTIWRWNRPLIGFDGEGRPHLRIEHRVIPAGPSIVDSIANASFYYGLVFSLANREIAPESVMDFEEAKSNFYAAAKGGLNGRIRWLDGGLRPVREVILEELLPLAKEGLRKQGVDGVDIDFYLGVMEKRVRSGRNGAAWQREYAARHGKENSSLLASYHRQQQRDIPVHDWEV